MNLVDDVASVVHVSDSMERHHVIAIQILLQLNQRLSFPTGASRLGCYQIKNRLCCRGLLQYAILKVHDRDQRTDEYSDSLGSTGQVSE